MTDLEVRHLCALGHRNPDRIPHTTPPFTVCPGHARAITDLIADLHRLWQLLPHLTGTASGGAATGDPSRQTPTRLDLLVLTDPATGIDPDGLLPPAHAILTGWATQLAEDRHLTPPTTITTAIHQLHTHHHWLPQQPHIRDITSELHLVRAAFRRVAGEQQHVIATCLADTGDDDTPCLGPLFQDVEDGRGLESVTCARCGDHWNQADLRLLASHTRRQAEAEARTAAGLPPDTPIGRLLSDHVTQLLPSATVRENSARRPTAS